MKRFVPAIQNVAFFLLCFVLFSLTARAQGPVFETNPFDSAPVLAPSFTVGAWYTDRYAPTIFEQTTFGGANVLHVGIRAADNYANRPIAFHQTFSNTQGRKYDFGNGNRFNTALTADLYVGADWATKHRMATVWATAYDATDASSIFNYIGFRNFSGTDPGFYVFGYHNIGGYTLLPYTVTYGQWYTFKIELTDSAFVYSINGTVVLTDTTLNGTKYFKDEMLQAYNFGDSTLAPVNQAFEDYDVYWDNAGAIPGQTVYSNPSSVALGTAGNFRLLAGTAVTIGTGTTITGDAGVSPGNTITNNGTLNGAMHLNDSAAIHAHSALAAAYTDVAARTVQATVPTELGGYTYGRGVYGSADGTFAINGILTLYGSATDVFIFKSASTLTTGSGCVVNLMGGATVSNVFWQVGSSATIDGNFAGNILAMTAVTQNTGGSINGRVLALNSFVTVNGLTVLPVELVRFDAVMGATGVRLDWSTLTETNSYGFYVERSNGNASHFTTVPSSFIPGAGTSLEQHNYSFTDNSVTVNGIYYYRLRQQDMEGNIVYSTPIKVEFSVLAVGDDAPREFRVYQNYPNPFNPTSTIRYQLADESSVLLTIVNVLGQRVRELVNATEQPGNHSIQFDASNLPSGIYYYHLDATGLSDPAKHFSRTMKMLLVR